MRVQASVAGKARSTSSDFPARKAPREIRLVAANAADTSVALNVGPGQSHQTSVNKHNPDVSNPTRTRLEVLIPGYSDQGKFGKGT